LKSLHSSINYRAIKREEQKKTNPFEGSYNLSKKTIDFIEQTASHLRQEKRRNPRELPNTSKDTELTESQWLLYREP